MNKRAFSLLLPAFLLIMSSYANLSFAQERGMPPGHPGMRGPDSMSSEQFGEGRHHRGGLSYLIKKLGITDEQKKQFRGLYVGFMDRTRKTRSDLMALKDEKKTMLISGKIDQQKLAQIDDQVVKLRSDLMKEALKLKRDRLALLTPEQLEKVADFRAEKAFRSKMKRFHHGPMGWGRPGPEQFGPTDRRADESPALDEGRHADTGQFIGEAPQEDED